MHTFVINVLSKHMVLLEEEVSETNTGDLSKDLLLKKPVEIKTFLDQYIIGQDETKRAMAVAVYNHYKRLLQTTDDEDEVEIEKVKSLY